MLINIILAFVEGFGLILSPCILPILPIVLSASVTGTKARPIGIIVGFILTFTVLTLGIRSIVNLTHIDPDILRYTAFALLLILGIIMLSTYLTEQFAKWTQGITNIGSNLNAIKQPQDGFGSGLLFGALIGVVWTPCAGPIIAAVIVQVVLQKTNVASILTVIAFALGAGLPMLIIALLGRQILTGFGIFKRHAIFIRRLLGLIIILTVCLLLYTSGTAFSFSATPIKNDKTQTSASLIDGITFPYPAPEISGIEAWINSPPITLANLRGKVVLIDFWTYSCINCVRTLPYIKNMYAKYHDTGFTVIGVHSPEFAFEHDLSNVQNAVKKYDIQYPVALDNRFVTWQNYHNEFWPAQYLINKDGMVVYQHFGEGGDDVIENNIRILLNMKEEASAPIKPLSGHFYQTPETYLGYVRSEHFASLESITHGSSALYSYPATLKRDAWALKGTWQIQADKIVATTIGAAIKLHFVAGQVYAVMGLTDKPITLKLFLNGKPIGVESGKDVAKGEVRVDRNQLYDLIHLEQVNDGTLEIIALQPGLEIYTFTFGN